MLVLFLEGARWTGMSTLVPRVQHGTRTEKSQGTVSLEVCQSGQCWSVITFERQLGAL